MNVSSDEIKKIMADTLQNRTTIAVIGMSADPAKPAHSVSVFMNSKGYQLVGVNPNKTQIAGFKCYPSLADVPDKDRVFVNVFRRPDAIPAVVDEVLQVGGVKVLWLQLGISHTEAEKKAEAAGIKVISNRCLAIEYNLHFKN